MLKEIKTLTEKVNQIKDSKVREFIKSHTNRLYFGGMNRLESIICLEKLKQIDSLSIEELEDLASKQLEKDKNNKLFTEKLTKSY